MPIPDNYVGREQTFAKHILLKNYLERLAYHILSSSEEFVYVDGFSGPWESRDSAHSDTSFAIVLQKLKQVKEGAERVFRRPKKIRCLFIEKDKITFAKLQTFIGQNKIEGIEVQILNGDFEDLIGEILKFIGTSFSFIFIDPTGWTGYSYEKIRPLFQHKGEFLINFMYNFIQRFAGDDREKIKKGFEKLFGGGDWEGELAALGADETAVVELYCQRLKKISSTLDWKVVYTPISHPEKDRTWFYLIYATTHSRGLRVFHEVEAKILEEYGEVRKETQYNKKTMASGQPGLFGHAIEAPREYPLDSLRYKSGVLGRQKILDYLKLKGATKYTILASELLQLPLVSEKVLKGWLKEMVEKDLISLQNAGSRGAIKDETIVALKANTTS